MLQTIKISTFASLFQKLNSYRQIVYDISKLALPITIGQLGLVLMGTSDVVMLGKYNTLAMSSAGFGNSVFFLFMLLGIGTMYAVSTITSIVDGENKPEQAIPIFFSSLKVALLLSVILIGINLWMCENLDFFKQSPEMSKLGREYLSIVTWSVPALLFFNSGKQLLDGLSRTQASMYITFIGLALNILLNYILIYGKLGFSEMGLAGAAWATVISRFAMAFMMLAVAWYHPLMKELKKKTHVAKSYFMEILKIGVPVGFTFFFEIAAFSIAMIFAGQISNTHSAAHQIAISLASVTYMFVTGIAAAGNIVVGNHYGAHDAIGLRRSGLAAILLTIVIESFFAMVFLLFNDLLPELYTSDAELLRMTPALVILAAFFQLSDGLQAVAAGVLRGIKDTKISSVIAFVSYWLLMTPGAYYLCFYTSMGINGIWLAFVVGLSFAAILLLYRFHKKSKELIVTNQFED